MKNDIPVADLSNIRANLYPHLKVTSEEFPRVLATRRIENDGAKYFGAFLPKTAVRMLIDFVNRTFRLRSCDINIDGNFPVPCTQYFRRRCLAPCVSSICSRDEYLKIVELVKVFLANERQTLVSKFNATINELSTLHDFENAARYRDMIVAVDKFWNEPRKKVWLDDAIDSFAFKENVFHLVTHRGRSVLGRKVFAFLLSENDASERILETIIDSFYQFHLPKEIRIPFRLANQHKLERRLSHRFRREARIVVSDPATKGANAFRGLNLSHSEHLLDQIKPVATPATIARELKTSFGLDVAAKRIAAFDVAHISGSGFIAAFSVWENGLFLSTDYGFVVSPENTELGALAAAVKGYLSNVNNSSDLIVLDGGKPQLNKVARVVNNDARGFALVAAVKPKGKHSSIASFLLEGSPSVMFNRDSPAHSVLQLLRDEAHGLANRVHRDYREMLPFYEAKGFERPLVVPLRFHAANGNADDLIPIRSI